MTWATWALVILAFVHSLFRRAQQRKVSILDWDRAVRNDLRLGVRLTEPDQGVNGQELVALFGA